MRIKNLLRPGGIMTILAILVLLTSCGKRGCTNGLAENFEPDAKVDCSCCYYFGKALFWYTPDYFKYNLEGKYSILYFYVDGVLKGQTRNNLSYSAHSQPDLSNSYRDNSPDKNDRIILIDLGDLSEKMVLVQVKTDKKNTIYNRSVSLKGSTVTTIQLN